MAKDVDARQTDARCATPTEARIETAALCVLVSLFAGVGAWTWWRLIQAYLS